MTSLSSPFICPKYREYDTLPPPLSSLLPGRWGANASGTGEGEEGEGAVGVQTSALTAAAVGAVVAMSSLVRVWRGDAGGEWVGDEGGEVDGGAGAAAVVTLRLRGMRRCRADKRRQKEGKIVGELR